MDQKSFISIKSLELRNDERNGKLINSQSGPARGAHDRDFWVVLGKLERSGRLFSILVHDGAISGNDPFMDNQFQKCNFFFP